MSLSHTSTTKPNSSLNNTSRTIGRVGEGQKGYIEVGRVRERSVLYILHIDIFLTSEGFK
jgi:hypothetical protein